MPVLDLPRDPPLAAWPRSGTIGILDLEFTAWDGSFRRGWSEAWEWREVVQIGFLLVDATDFAPGAAIEKLVRPRRNPLLSEYFTALTGVTQQRVDTEGVPFAEALEAFRAAAEPAATIIFNGQDGQILRENCALVDLPFPPLRDRMFDFRPLLAKTLRRPASDLVSSELPALAGIRVEGRVHSALHDCRAIAASLATWRAAGVL
jgi:inhibitor of KinA sporulation pathway (predicted exonuclease)